MSEKKTCDREKLCKFYIKKETQYIANLDRLGNIPKFYIIMIPSVFIMQYENE